MTSQYIETTGISEEGIQNALDKLSCFSPAHVSGMHKLLKDIRPMKIRYTRKYTAKTHDGLYRKTRIMARREFFFSGIYKSKAGKIIGMFISNNEPIQDTYNGKERSFSHIEIPINEVVSVFTVDDARNFLVRLSLETLRYLDDTPHAMEEAKEVESIEERYKGVSSYGAFS